MRRWQTVGTWVLAAACLLASAAVVTISASAKRVPSHDEAISFLAASGKQASYERRAAELTGEPHPASKWQALWQPASALEFGAVSRGLRDTDVHPPLYFWLLHLLTLITGASLGAAVALNVAIAVATAALVGWSAKALGASSHASSLAAAAFLTSNASLAAIFDARPYALLALWVAMLIAALIAWTRSKSLWALVAIGLSTAAGLLTHYQFGLVLGATAVTGMLRLTPRQLVKPAAFAVVGALVAAVLHPGTVSSLERVRRLPGVELSLGDRGERVVSSMLELVMPRSWAVSISEAGAVVVLVLLAAGLVWLWSLAARSERETIVRWIALSIVSLAIILYVCGVGPHHAMAPKYLLLCLPPGLVAAAQVRTSIGRTIAVGVVLAQLVGLVGMSARLVRHQPVAPCASSSSAQLVLRSADRGHVIRRLWCVEAERIVIVRPTSP